MVSVIVPNYNHAPYLKRRINSILNQSYQNFELIILDDCSTDNSREVIEQFRQHPKVQHIIFNEKNSGSTFPQWEKGIALAQGEWVWIAESDDWCEPNFLQELLSGLFSSEGYVLGFCQSLMVTSENQVINRTSAKFLEETVEGSDFVKASMAGTNRIVNASMALFKREAVYKIPGGYQQMKYCGDWFFWVQLCMLGKIFISGKYLNYYMRHKANVASKAITLGYDFTEGSRIYQFIKAELGLNAAEKKQALATMLELYFVLRDRFLNQQVHEEVLNNLYGLEPYVKAMIKSQERKEKFKKIDTGFREFLKKLLLRQTP